MCALVEGHAVVGEVLVALVVVVSWTVVAQAGRRADARGRCPLFRRTCLPCPGGRLARRRRRGRRPFLHSHPIRVEPHRAQVRGHWALGTHSGEGGALPFGSRVGDSRTTVEHSCVKSLGVTLTVLPPCGAAASFVVAAARVVVGGGGGELHVADELRAVVGVVLVAHVAGVVRTMVVLAGRLADARGLCPPFRRTCLPCPGGRLARR